MANQAGTALKPEVKAAWLEALRSGKYKQGRGVLNDGDTHCCLGVLCEIATDAGVVQKRVDSIGAASYNGGDLMPPREVSEWAFGSGYAWQSEWVVPDRSAEIAGQWIALSALNDERGASFATIADIIEVEL